MNYHYLAQYMASTQHKLTVSLIGCGGTGTHVLTNLAAMNNAMIHLGRQPIHVYAFDHDIVEEHNIGRQMFSPADVGENKAVVLIERINRYFGYNWVGYPIKFDHNLPKDKLQTINLMITCIDKAKTRRDIGNYVAKNAHSAQYVPDNRLYYWMDIGNGLDYGQIILGTIRPVVQPGANKKSIPAGALASNLPCWPEEFKGIRDKKEEPSCSLAESLGRQDLFINKIMASYATNMLWQLFKNYRINYRGLYVNLDSMRTMPIPV